MEIKDYSERFAAFTSKASEVNRQLALAGIAVVWIFGNSATQLIEPALVKPLFFFLLTLALDLLHYLVGSIIWGLFFEIKEWQVNKKKIKNENIKAPNSLSLIINIIFVMKFISMILATIHLLKFLAPKFNFNI